VVVRAPREVIPSEACLYTRVFWFAALSLLPGLLAGRRPPAMAGPEVDAVVLLERIASLQRYLGANEVLNGAALLILTGDASVVASALATLLQVRCYVARRPRVRADTLNR
jgi:hypothetical protein